MAGVNQSLSRVNYILVLVIMVSGCSFFRKRHAPAVNYNKPYESAVTCNFKSTAQESAKTCQRAGLNLLEQNYPGEAQAYFIKALDLDPKLYMSWYCLGIINIDKKEGYDYLKKSADIKPDFAPSYYWMAYYKCRNRKDKEAVSLFKKYLEVAQGNKDEAVRVKVAKEILADLLAGKEGQSLSMIRRMPEEDK